ncbi:hypothetical protein HK405_004316, partial [Cladochytrium tenue]
MSTPHGLQNNAEAEAEDAPLLAPELPDGTLRQRRSALRTGLSAVAAAAVTAALLLAALVYVPRLVGTPDLAAAVEDARLEAHLLRLADTAASDPAYGNSRSIARGYNASVGYVVSQLTRHTDYVVSVQPFPLGLFENAAPPLLQYAGSSNALLPGVDYDTINNCGSGAVDDAPLAAVLDGCNAADFAGISKGAVVLLAREPPTTAPGLRQLPPSLQCTYRTKLGFAAKAGAGAVLLYSLLPGDGFVLGRVGPDVAGRLPVLGVTHGVALDLLARLVTAGGGGADVRVTVHADVRVRNVTTLNVVADTRSGDPDNTIVLGSHLDSVPAGPGINDDASGTAATLEVALSLYRTGLSRRLVNRVRFAWWSAEELGLIGSTYYVQDLAKNNPDELKKIALNLNNDMIASPNGVRFIYHGFAAEDPKLRGPSGKIQALYEKYFDDLRLAHELTPFDGRSDYGEFLKFGIPA